MAAGCRSASVVGYVVQAACPCTQGINRQRAISQPTTNLSRCLSSGLFAILRLNVSRGVLVAMASWMLCFARCLTRRRAPGSSCASPHLQAYRETVMYPAGVVIAHLFLHKDQGPMCVDHSGACSTVASKLAGHSMMVQGSSGAWARRAGRCGAMPAKGAASTTHVPSMCMHMCVPFSEQGFRLV
jgi:hypothetical protein